MKQTGPPGKAGCGRALLKRNAPSVLEHIGIILLLLLLNGFFAMAEFAVVSARRARLRQMAEGEGQAEGARRALALVEDPSAFLSLIQVGVTLVSVLLGVFSGATLAGDFGAYLNGIGGVAPFGDTIALAVTVAGVTYLSLVIGELAPKRIGLAFAEPIAVRVSGFMLFFARMAAPVVWLLRASTELLLAMIGLRGATAAPVTEEEIKDMIAEGTEKGVFKPAEKDMIESVMRMADRTVRTVMTPRIDMVWLSLEDPTEDNIRIVLESGYSRFPLARGDMEEVVGIVRAKDLLNAVLRDGEIDLQALMRPPVVVPDTTPVLRLLDQFKQTGRPLAIVIDEYGSVEGMVTVTDILEAIVGDLPEPGQAQDARPVRRADGSWLIDGMTPVDEVEMLTGLKNMRDGEEFHTVAGFVIDQLGRLPATGDVFTWEGARFEVVDMDGRRVDKVLIVPPARSADEDAQLPL